MLYSLLNMIATGALVLYNLLHYRQKKELLGGVSRSVMKHFQEKGPGVLNRALAAPVIWTVLEIAIITYCQYWLTGYFNVMLGEVLDTGSNYFGNLFSAPVLVLLACLLLRIDFLAQMDLITPAFPLALFFSKIGCYTTACCGGIPWEYGYYNPVSRTIEFPIQLLEAAVGLLLFLVLQGFKKKFKKGTIFPIYLTAFSGIRFFTEFLRCEPNVLWGLKTYHFLCIAGVILGVIAYRAARKYDARMREKTENPHISA